MRKENIIPSPVQRKKSIIIPNLKSIKEEKTIKFKPKVKIIKKNNQTSASSSFQSLKDKPSKNLEKSTKSKKINNTGKSFINTLVANKPLIARQTQYINKRIY